MTPSGPKVLEYNVRFGDPETQSMMLFIESDLVEVLLACTRGRLEEVSLHVADSYACNVVVSAYGYPGEPRRGDEIRIDSHSEGKGPKKKRDLSSKIVMTDLIFRHTNLPCRDKGGGRQIVHKWWENILSCRERSNVAGSS